MINGVSWSLSFELLFYLLFGLVFIIPNKKISLSIAIIYSVILILVPLMGYDYNSKNTWINLVTFPMNIEFVLGIIAAVIISKLSFKLAKPLIFFGIVTFLINAELYNLHYFLINNSFNRVILFGIPSFAIITGLVKYELYNKINASILFLILGEASYSLYLIHLPIISACFKILYAFNLKNNLLVHCSIILIVCIICYASIVFYKFVEKPIIARLNSLRRIEVANEI